MQVTKKKLILLKIIKMTVHIDLDRKINYFKFLKRNDSFTSLVTYVYTMNSLKFKLIICLE